MHIHIQRDGREIGPYTLEQINDYLAQGTLFATDHAWHEGLPEWVPLNEIAGVASNQAIVPESACPKCGAFMELEQVFCIACGFDSRTGETIETQTGVVESKIISDPPQPNVHHQSSVLSDEDGATWEDETTETYYETETSFGWAIPILGGIIVFALLVWWDPESTSLSQVEIIHNNIANIESEFVDNYNGAPSYESQIAVCNNTITTLDAVDFSSCPEDYAEGVRNWRSCLERLKDALKSKDSEAVDQAMKQSESAILRLNRLAR